MPRHPPKSRSFTVKISHSQRPNGGSRSRVTIPKRIINEIRKDSSRRPRYGLYKIGLDQHSWFESKDHHVFKCPHCRKKISPKDVTDDG